MLGKLWSFSPGKECAWSQQGFWHWVLNTCAASPCCCYEHAALALPESVSCQVVTTQDRASCIASAKLPPLFVGAPAHHPQPCSTLHTCVLCTPGADCLLTAFRKSLPHLQMHFPAGGRCSTSGAIAQGLCLAVPPHDPVAACALATSSGPCAVLSGACHED